MRKRNRTISLAFLYVFVLSAFLAVAVWGSRGVTVFNETAPFNDRNTIIIDAGHGYPDGGATSCTGVLECDINLQVSRRLNDLLIFLGMNTKMVRESESSVYTKGNSIGEKKISDLKNRVELINNTEDALLVSIHQNYFQDSKYHGAQVFYNEITESKLLAQILQKSFVENLNPGSKRQIKKASGIYLMEKVGIPAVLIECGFLSNPEEEHMLRNENYQKIICCVIASCISQYVSDA